MTRFVAMSGSMTSTGKVTHLFEQAKSNFVDGLGLSENITIICVKTDQLHSRMVANSLQSHTPSILCFMSTAAVCASMCNSLKHYIAWLSCRPWLRRATTYSVMTIPFIPEILRDFVRRQAPRNLPELLENACMVLCYSLEHLFDRIVGVRHASPV